MPVQAKLLLKINDLEHVIRHILMGFLIRRYGLLLDSKQQLSKLCTIWNIN